MSTNDMVFPASAGMIPPDRCRGRCAARVPRKRGDDPNIKGYIGKAILCSPQARG